MSAGQKAKVFGIGFHKTGTTSLAQALTQLGYRVTGENGVRDPQIATNVYDMAFALAEEFDAFQDNPWPLLYREMDARYPGSKFILTLRPEEAWLRSVLQNFSGQDTPMRRWIYGAGDPAGNESIYLDRYRRHNQAVQDYFRDRPADLLVFRITEGEGWEKLCPFLGRPIPSEPFPRINTARQRQAHNHWWRRLRRRLARLRRRITRTR